MEGIDMNEIITPKEYLDMVRDLGEMKGVIEAISWWDVPQELKDNLKKFLEKKEKQKE